MNLEFSSEQEQVASIFTAYRNDIDIYTEDENKDRPFYKKLFLRLLNDSNIKLHDVYPLGSSNNVINACQKDTDSSRKKIYIVDGDIYLLFNPKQKIHNLYVLDAYCMENLVIDEGSVCNALCNLYAEKEYDEIKELFQFDLLIEKHQDALITLFYYKALDQKYRGHFDLYTLSKYYDKHRNLDLNKVIKEQDDIKNNLISKGLITEEKFKQEIITMEEKFPKCPSTLLKIVSGKDYLIYMISCQAQKKLGHNTGHTKEVWKYNFAQYCNLGRLQGLKTAIMNCIKDQA